MPKGVYPRGNKNAVRIDVADEAPRPEAANARVVEVARQTDSEDKMSTTEKLFGDVQQQQEEMAVKERPIVQDPLSGTEDAPLQEETSAKPDVENEESGSEPIETQGTSKPDEDYLDLDKFGSKKVKAKIDGREETTTFKEVLGQYQLKKHLSEAADRVGEERRKLAEERRQLQELRQQQSMNVPRETIETSNGQYAPPPYQQPSFDPVQQRISDLEQQLRQVVEGTRPAMYESNRQRVANELKGQGFNDFLDYIPKMESHILNVQDPQLVQFYDSPMGAKSLYFQLKAQELNQPQRMTQASKPISTAQQIPETRVDSGSSPSSGVNDDASLTYRKAFRRASNLGDDKDAWNDVLRQKGIIPD